MLIDSHCHLDRLDLLPYNGDFSTLITASQSAGVGHFLCIAIDLPSYPALKTLVKDFSCISLSVGVHPNTQDNYEPSVEDLIDLGNDTQVIAIGETGLDYFRSQGDLNWQHQRFRRHIAAAKALKKPLIIHTRQAREDTLRILREEKADDIGGIIHCFSEDWEFAQQALALNFYLSFSGIVTFNSAKSIQEVARLVPADRFLIETDAPYLAPNPHRGKPNYPHYVKHVAEKIAQLRDISVDEVANLSSANFHRLFSKGDSMSSPLV